MPDCQFAPSIRAPKRLLVAAALALSLLSNPASANEKRISIPLALPHQQQATSQQSASSSPAPSVQATPFTQSATTATAVQPARPLAPAPASTVPPKPAVVATPPAPVAAPKAAPATPKPAPKPVAAAPAKTQPATPAKPAAAPAPKVAPSAAPKPAAAPATASHKAIPLINTAEIKAPRYTQGNPEVFVTQFEDYVAKEIAPRVPGVAIAVVSQGKIQSLRAFGVRRTGGKEPMTPDTVFRLASVSKPVAATATAIMVQEGGLRWDSLVSAELPQVKFKNARYGSQITLEHLLSQSVGLPSHSNTSVIEAGMSYAEAVRRLSLVNFVCPPGKCYAYQNITYSLAGDMVSKRYGKPFDEFVEDKLFGPLQMRSASFGLEPFLASPNRATPHVANGNRWVTAQVTPNYYRIAPAAGANASIVDMSRFLMAQLGKRPDVLPTTTLAQLHARVTPNSAAQNHYGTREAVGNTAYGLGWRVFDYGRYKHFVHHGGWVRGFRSEMVFNRELGIGMVFLTNSESRLARDVIFKFMDYHESAKAEANKAKR